MEREVVISRVESRSKRNPRNEAQYVLGAMAGMFRELVPEFPDGAFATYFIRPAFDAVFPAGDRLSSELSAELDPLPPGEIDPIGGLYLFALGCAYAADAVKAMNTGNKQLAWTMICDAHYYRGMLFEMWCTSGEKTNASVESSDAIKRIMAGASAGGRKSAAVRQANKKVPMPEALRAERDSLIARGVPARGVAGLLAMRYACTAAHIRNELNRN